MGSKKKPYARTTITVPLALKRRMKQVQGSVNWSAVACRAFEAKLEELSQDEETQTVQEVIERLRKLKQESSESDALSVGRMEGRVWAMNNATPEQFERLEAFRERMSDTEWNTLFQTEQGWRELARQLDPRVSPKRPGGPGKEKSFWKRIVDKPKVHEPEFFQGFAEGVLGVWREVKDQI